MAEAITIVDTARRYGAELRLTGGLAVRHYCTDLEFMDREFSDIDFIGLSPQSRELHRAFVELGYDENVYVTQATSGDQLQYVKREQLLESHAHFLKRPHQLPSAHATPVVDHVDVFLDVMRMDHDVDVRPRFGVDDYAISPVDVLVTKLQIGRINEKDVHDVIALLKDVPLRQTGTAPFVDVPCLARLCAQDWGIFYDITTNITIVLNRIDDYVLSDEEYERVKNRLRMIDEAIEEEGKSLRWRLRARVGKRLPWRREIEENEGSPIIAPEWDWRRDLG